MAASAGIPMDLEHAEAVSQGERAAGFVWPEFGYGRGRCRVFAYRAERKVEAPLIGGDVHDQFLLGRADGLEAFQMVSEELPEFIGILVSCV
jgi:hypothetical protein